jgi:hypothetical protein
MARACSNDDDDNGLSNNDAPARVDVVAELLNNPTGDNMDAINDEVAAVDDNDESDGNDDDDEVSEDNN